MKLAAFCLHQSIIGQSVTISFIIILHDGRGTSHVGNAKQRGVGPKPDVQQQLRQPTPGRYVIL